MENGKVFEAISAIMLEIDPIGKDKKNTQQGFNFRGIDDVYNNLQKLMAKHKVFSVPVVLESHTEERHTANGKLNLFRVLRIQYDFYGCDGSKFSAIVQGEGADLGDKASNKAMAVAHKYALMQVFAIPTEDIDPDAVTIDPMVKKPEPKKPDPKPFDAVETATNTQKFIADTEDSARINVGYKKFQSMEPLFKKADTMDIYNQIVAEFQAKALKLFGPQEGEISEGGI